MRALVVMAVLGASVAFPFIPDAPDVAAEKARFFKTFQVIQSAAVPKVNPYGLPAPQAYRQPGPSAPPPKWHGPLASQVPAGLQGSSAYVADTAEVAGARNAFFNTYKAQLAATRPKDPSSYSPYYTPTYQSSRPQPKWTGPLASKVPASLPGASPVVADTPEVRAAKASFYNSYTRALKATLPSPY